MNKEACPTCKATGGDYLNDNLINYSDGGKHCFACGHHEGGDLNSYQITEGEKFHTEAQFLGGKYEAVRGISKDTCEFFDYEVGRDSTGEVQIANYYKDGELSGQKIRGDDKRFYAVGDTSSLFGQDKYAGNKNLFITVTEGEIDALSIAEIQSTRFPVVSVPNGAQGSKSSIRKHLKYLQGFKYVILCFDMDEPGQKAARECAELFEPGACRIAKLPVKDVNELLTSGRSREMTGYLFNAQAIRPDGIIKLSEITDEEIQEAVQPGVTIKYPKLNHMLNGFRKQSLYTLVARAKSGKTTLTKEIVLDLVDQGHRVGVLYLEEDAVAEALSFVAMEEKVPHWQFMDDLAADKDKLKKVQERLATYEDRGLYLYNHKGVIDSKSVYDTVNYMVKGLECEIIVLDNVSISIAGTDAAANERKLIDNMVFDLVKLINNTKCTILTVVHVNQKGEGEDKLQRKDVFGSGAFLKFSRGLIALDKEENGRVQLTVLGNRAKGLEGAADLLKYNPDTGRLDVVEEVL